MKKPKHRLPEERRKDRQIAVRLPPALIKAAQDAAEKGGFESTSAWLRDLVKKNVQALDVV